MIDASLCETKPIKPTPATELRISASAFSRPTRVNTETTEYTIAAAHMEVFNGVDYGTGKDNKLQSAMTNPTY